MKQALIYLLFSALALTSCLKAMYHISKSDEKWLSTRNQGDIILFRSENEVDTMTIVKKSVADQILPIASAIGDTTFHGTGSLHFTLKHRGSTISGWVIVAKESDDRLRLSIRIGKRQFDVSDTRHVKYSAKQMGRTFFKDIIYVDSTNSELFSYDEYTPRSFSWSKLKGLLQYVYPNGETYTFYKIITHDSMSESNDKQTRFDRLLDEIKEIIDRL